MTDGPLLRELTEADLPILFEHQADPESSRLAAFPSRDREAFTAHLRKILGDPSVLVRAIVSDGEVVGNVLSFDRDGSRLVGYWLGREFWGRGLATRALAEFLTVERARPLQAHVAKHNVGSLRVLEKCGFVVASDGVIEFEGEQIEEFVLRLD